ncbi:DDIAS protein, partial [Amia calva]|nr:DDIAS protein [Amia calva]
MRDSRYSCKKCGFTCEVHNISYRYRLSFSVAKDSDILRLSVFGSCLDPYFGVSAGFLQRFVEEVKQEVGDRVQKILIQAVEDCFVGRSFIFGLRVS